MFLQGFSAGFSAAVILFGLLMTIHRYIEFRRSRRALRELNKFLEDSIKEQRDFTRVIHHGKEEPRA